MRTKILSLMLMFVAISGLATSTYAASNADYTILNNIKAINKIEVYGNVEVFISTNANEQVTVYNKYYSQSALVQSNKGVLRISSYNTEKLIVWVNASDLRSVSAYDNAEVKSFGNVSAIEFNVDLHNNATAKLNLDVYSADVTLKDNAKIELSGNAVDFNVNHITDSSVSKADFTATNYTDHKPVVAAAVKNDELTGLE